MLKKTKQIKLAGSLILTALITAATGLAHSAETTDAADLIYHNGKIYTVNTEQPWADAVAIKDGVFLKVGSDAEMASVTGSNTRTVDLGGRFAMPGLFDTHIHPDMAADNMLNIGVSPTQSWPEVATAIRRFLVENPDAKWVYGGMLNWLKDSAEPIQGSDAPSHRTTLDRIVSDRPAALWDQGGHALLVNSRALEIANITRDTADPVGGTIGRDSNGEPSGVLRETATNLVLSKLELPDDEKWLKKGLKPFIEQLNSLGITAITQASGEEKSLAALKKLSDQDQLTLRVFTHISAPLDYSTAPKKAQQTELLNNRAAYSSPLINPNGIKYVLDGSAAGQTAVMLEPFIGHNHRGHYRNEIHQVSAELQHWDQKGVAVKAHGIGDRAIREVLDAFAVARRYNPEGPRHSIAHGTFIHPDDIRRFAELNIVYEASPTLWFPNPGRAIIEQDIGKERTNRAWPLRELDQAGAVVSYGSDWPVAFSPSPWEAVETMITRQKPGGSVDTFGEEHGVDLATALKIVTLNGAYSMALEDATGSIEPGKSADLVVLDQNLFEIPATEIHKSNVVTTLLRGKVIYAREH